MKILYVTSYPLEYSTSANIRNMGLIRGLVENGHEVSTFSIYPTDKNFFTGRLLDFPFYKRYWIGPKISVTVNMKKKSLSASLKKLVFDLYADWMVYDSKALSAKQIKAGMIEEEYDLVISSSDPKSAHLFAEKLIKKHPGFFPRWIQYWGDPFSNDISTGHKHSERRTRREEERLISLADKVVYVSPFTREDLAKKYSEFSDKMIFLPIPFAKKQSTNNVETEKNLVGYLGDYSSKNRNILPFVDAVNNSGIKTVIAGSSDLDIQSSDYLTVKGRLHGDEIDDLAERVGVYVCVCNLKGTQIPGKVYHYADTGKPILIVLDGDKEDALKGYFESYDRFYLCKNTTEDITRSLKEILRDYKTFTTPRMLQPRVIAEDFIK